ncbi:MAG: M20/M25/M40 family metallo-hydrolase [Gemmatimonadetes bacterium]|nr:M20/M25/M40 family metallo-hydrolase [Gemmatimonadota bacterium]NIO30625.1 M20/M25/M40 family metallo-hydrolase [Gemmatimonadota bacterium]
MRFRLTVLLALCLLAHTGPSSRVLAQSGGGESIADSYREVAQRLIGAALADSAAYERLTELTDGFGHRFSGSENLERALDWIIEEMGEDGLENVRAESVPVPHWVRGAESLELIAPRRMDLPMLGLGGSVGTPKEGIRAELLVVSSFDELELRSEQARGKIVLLNAPFVSYGKTVTYRVHGAIAAAKAGAVASLIRSVTPFSMRTPHTGQMLYDPSAPQIPHAAITVEDADMLQRMQERGERIEVLLKMEAQTLPETMSRNVIAEIVGWEHPEEVVVMGGHIDSWDVGTGAMDDGGGSVAAWEALRLMHDLGLRPRRTVRVVLWTNEENGLRGALAYRDYHIDELNDHILAIESDAGVFKPLGFGFTGSAAAYEIVQEIGTLLQPIGADHVGRGGGGADIGPIMRDGVPGMGLQVDGERYFWYHHTEADTIEVLDPREMAECVAAMAVMAYVVADLPQRLPR